MMLCTCVSDENTTVCISSYLCVLAAGSKVYRCCCLVVRVKVKDSLLQHLKVRVKGAVMSM